MPARKDIWIDEDGSVPENITVIGIAMNTDGTPNNSLGGMSVLVHKEASFNDLLITGATQANPVVMTVPGHGFANDSIVMHDQVSGMTQINGVWYRVKNVTTNTYELWSLDTASVGIDGTGFGAFVATGTPTAHLMEKWSANTLVHRNETGTYGLVLAATERNAIGDGYWELYVSGVLVLHSDFRIVPDDPWAAATTKDDIVNGLIDAVSGIKRNTAFAGFAFVMTDSTTHQPKTNLTVTATVSLDGAAFVACANAPTEIGGSGAGYGGYTIDFTAADLNGGTVLLRFTASGADDRLIVITTEAAPV